MKESDQEAQAAALHARHPVIDVHSDIPHDLLRQRKAGQRRVFEQAHWPKLRDGGVDGEAAAVGGDSGVLGPQAVRDTLETLDALREEAAETPDRLTIALTAADFLTAKRAGRHAVLMGLEGGAPLNGSLALLRTYHRLGIRWLGLTWNYRNELADGCAEARSAGGLTRFGVNVVKACGQLGIVVDVSHLSDTGIDHVLQVAESPVIASHANARAVTDHVRNLSDRHLDGIARSGGVVGIVFFADFVSGDPTSATLEQVLDHVDYVKQRIGVEHIAVGADFVDYFPGAGGMSAAMAGVGVYSGLLTSAAGLSSAADFQAFTVGLLRRGYDEAEIAAILGGNVLRVLSQVATMSVAHHAT
jgi:membrane dipeptidase